jgi:single-strand DNA-binding protein
VRISLTGGDGTAAHGIGEEADPLPELGRNEVVLVGRVSGTPEDRVLPSGDALVCWRIVVPRPAARRPSRSGARPPTVDTLDCVVWSAALRRAALRLSDGDLVGVEGALRRRFWRAGPGVSSRYEIEVRSLRRVRAPA